MYKSATVFLHQNDYFWRTTTKTPGNLKKNGILIKITLILKGISTKIQESSQLQCIWEDVKTIPNELCSEEPNDKCFENYVQRDFHKPRGHNIKTIFRPF